MNRYLLSAAIAALVLPAAACNDERNKTAAAKDTTTVAESDTATTSDKMATDEASNPYDTTATNTAGQNVDADTTAGMNVVYLMPGEISAKDFFGDDIYGAGGEKIASVDDVLIDTNGKAQKLIFIADGGLFGFAGNKGSIDIADVSMKVDSGNEPLVRISLTEEQAKNAVAFDQAGLNDYRLASEIIGSEVDLASTPNDKDEEAVIRDLVLTSDGNVKNIILEHSIVGVVGGGDLYALDYSKLTIEEGDGGLSINVSENEMENAPIFKYHMDDAVEKNEDIKN